VVSHVQQVSPMRTLAVLCAHKGCTRASSARRRAVRVRKEPTPLQGEQQHANVALAIPFQARTLLTYLIGGRCSVSDYAY
jgi:hypothetical protein